MHEYIFHLENWECAKLQWALAKVKVVIKSIFRMKTKLTLEPRNYLRIQLSLSPIWAKSKTPFQQINWVQYFLPVVQATQEDRGRKIMICGQFWGKCEMLPEK
jgi:hypothetical protein